jgi:hypothetical protein
MYIANKLISSDTPITSYQNEIRTDDDGFADYKNILQNE